MFTFPFIRRTEQSAPVVYAKVILALSLSLLVIAVAGVRAFLIAAKLGRRFEGASKSPPQARLTVAQNNGCISDVQAART